MTETNVNYETELANELEVALTKIEELEAKAKEASSVKATTTKKHNEEVAQLKSIIEKQEDLVAKQQEAIVELSNKCEAAYAEYNKTARMLDAVALLLGK